MTPWAAVLALCLALQDPPPATDPQGDPIPAGAAFRLGSSRFQHADRLTDIRFTGDGKKLVSTGWFSIRVWDVESGRMLHRISGGQGSLEASAFSPDVRTIYSTGCNILETIAWDAESGKEKFRLQGFGEGPNFTGGGAPTVAISADGKRLATSIRDDAFRVWDLEKKREIFKRATADGEKLHYGGRMDLSPDGRLLAAMGLKALYVLDVDTGKVAFRIDGSAMFPRFSADGRKLACGGPKRLGYQVWDVADGKKLYDIEGPYPMSFRWAPDGSACAWWNGAVVIGDPATGEARRKIEGVTYPFDFSPDGKLLAATSGSTIRLFDPATGLEVNPTGGGATGLYPIWEYSPDGRLIATSGQKGLRFWDPGTGKEIQHLEIPGGVSSLSFSEDGRSITTLETDYKKFATVRRWDLLSGRETSRFDHDPNLFSSGASLGGFGRLLLAARYSQGGAMVDANTGESICPLKGSVLSVSPDGSRVIIQERNMTCFDIPSRKDLWSGTAVSETSSAAFSPDGREVLISTRAGVRVLDSSTGKQLRELPTDWSSSYGMSLTGLSPDGATLLTTAWDAKRIEHWNARAPGSPRVFTLPEGPGKAAFSSDGSTWAASLQDSTILIWTLKPAPAPAPGDRTPAALWARLGSKDLIEVWKSAEALAGHKDGEELVREKLRVREPRPVDPAHAQWTKILNDEDIAVREKALADLRGAGPEAEPALLAALDAKPASDTESLLIRLLDAQSNRPAAAGGESRRLAAIRVLEKTGAREILESLRATSTSWAERRTAEAALGRLDRKK